MASVPETPPPITARVDSVGRLVEADPLLADLQAEAGSALGGKLALPQLAAVARLVRKLGISVSRPAIVGARDHDVEMWVRADPDGDDVILTIEKWKKRPPSPSRLDVAASDDDLIGKPAPHSWATDAELRFTALSDDLAEQLGIDAGEAVGQPLTRFMRLEEGDDGAMPLLAAVAARSAFSGQFAAARNNGNQRLLLSGDPVRTEDGGFAGFRGRALADRVAIPEAANESGSHTGIDPALDQALRSPLARIIEAAEGIVDRADGPLRSDYAAYAGDIAAAARHLLAVIRSMVDQPADAGGTVDLAILAGDALALVQPQADERGVTLALKGESAIPVHGDRRGIIQILVNLLGNAVRHSPEGGSVTLDLRASGAMGEASIADQGEGIPSADHERVFEKFERLDGAGGGAGLGLAIARRLARSMGGEIGLVSAPGEGACFTLSLLLASAQRSPTGT